MAYGDTIRPTPLLSMAFHWSHYHDKAAFCILEVETMTTSVTKSSYTMIAAIAYELWHLPPSVVALRILQLEARWGYSTDLLSEYENTDYWLKDTAIRLALYAQRHNVEDDVIGIFNITFNK